MTSVALTSFDLALPTDEHRMLRDQVRAFVKAEVEPQALEFDRRERFNIPLFKKAGALGLLGIRAAEYRPALDAIAACRGP